MGYLINMNMSKTKKMVMLAVFSSQAIVLSIIENWIPMPSTFPGVKLGLANIMVIVTIVFFGFKDALILVAIRTVISSLLMGGVTVFLFSISGGILSTVVMSFLYHKYENLFSIIGISIAGAVMHNIGQLLMASFMMKDLSVMNYLPILMISAVVTGCFVGLCSNYLINALNKSKIFM